MYYLLVCFRSGSEWAAVCLAVQASSRSLLLAGHPSLDCVSKEPSCPVSTQAGRRVLDVPHAW